MTGYPHGAVAPPNRPRVRWRPLVAFHFWAEASRLDIATRGLAYADGYRAHWRETARGRTR